jgi:hypothetical protein
MLKLTKDLQKLLDNSMQIYYLPSEQFLPVQTKNLPVHSKKLLRSVKKQLGAASSGCGA